MSLIFQTSRNKFAELAKDFDHIDSIYDWHLKKMPSSLRSQSRRPRRLLGHNGCFLLYKLLSRSRDLIHGIGTAYNIENALCGYMAARAHCETTGTVAYFLKKLRLFYADDLKYDELDVFLRRMFLGSRALPGPDRFKNENLEVPQPIQVMTLIDAVDDLFQKMSNKKETRFRESYEDLSDFCHPNFAGISVGARVMRSQLGVLHFTPGPSMTVEDARLISTSSNPSLALFKCFWSEAVDLLKQNEETPLLYEPK